MISIQDVPLPVPAIKIKDIDAEIRDVSIEIILDKVIIQGVIHKQIFFVGTDNIIHHQTDDMPFNTFVDVPGATPGMVAQVDIDIEKILANLNPEGTVIVQKVILEIFVKVEEEQVIRIALDETGRLIELNQFVVEGEKQIIKENEVILNQTAVKVEEIRARIIDLDTELIADKVIVQGVIDKQVFFINEDDMAVHQGEEISFSTFIDLPGAQPGMDVDIKSEIEFIGFDLSEDGNTLTQKIVLQFSARATQPIQERIATGVDFLVKVPVVIGEDTTQLMKTNRTLLDQPAQKIKRIDARLLDINSEIFDNKVIVQGTIHKQIFFIGNDNLEHHQAEDVPFNTFLEIPGASPGQNVRVEPVIEDIIFHLLDEDLLEQKIIIEVFVKVEEINQLNILPDDAGPAVVLPVVVGENRKQILVEQEVPPPPPPPPPPQEITIEFITIVKRAAIAVEKQEILDNIIELPCPAIKVKNIEAVVENVEVEVVNDNLAIVTGIVVKDIAFVCPDNIVRHLEEIIPFVIEIPLPEPVDPDEITVDVTVEDIIFTLLEGGEAVREIVVLKASIQGADSPRFITMVTLIEGPEITTETILVREEVVISEEPLITELQTFPVVTDVNDPLGLLSNIVKETLVLNVVGEGEIPVEVVVFAE